MLTCIVSNQVARRLRPRSLHVDALHRRGVDLQIGPEAGVMQTLQVRSVMHDNVEAVTERAPFREVVDYFLRTPRSFLHVVDDDGRFVGAIPLHAIKQALSAAESLDVVLAGDLVEPLEFLTPEASLAQAMEAFWRQHSERLPVVASEESPVLLGWISQRDLIGVYSQEVLRKRHLLTRFTMPDASGRERAAYVELPEGFEIRTLVVPPRLEGRTIAEIAARSGYGVQVLQIRRYDPLRQKRRVELPGAASVLRAYDRLVVIGPSDGLRALRAGIGLSAEPGGTADS
jgi:CBS domain-containing protein